MVCSYYCTNALPIVVDTWSIAVFVQGHPYYFVNSALCAITILVYLSLLFLCSAYELVCRYVNMYLPVDFHYDMKVQHGIEKL